MTKGREWKKTRPMTEFETATIAFQNASLWAAYIQAGGAGLVGMVQCALIFYGLKLMQRSNTDRQRQMDLAEKRHEESLLTLRTLIEWTAPR